MRKQIKEVTIIRALKKSNINRNHYVHAFFLLRSLFFNTPSKFLLDQVVFRTQKTKTEDFLSAHQSTSEKMCLFAISFNNICPHCLFPCLQYITRSHKAKRNKGMDISNPYGNYHYSMPFYPQYYPYYNYWGQDHINMPQSIYPPVNSPVLPASESTEPKTRPKLQYSSDFTSQQQEQSVIEPCLKTRSKTTKQSLFAEKVERIRGKLNPDQKENRNVYSNILRNFFRKVNDYSKIEGLIQKIILRRGLQLTKKEFIDYIKKIKINHSKYLRFKKLRKIFASEHLRQHSMVFRILLSYFTKEELLLQSLTSRKIGKWSVILHLKGARDLKEKLFH